MVQARQRTTARDSTPRPAPQAKTPTLTWAQVLTPLLSLAEPPKSAGEGDSVVPDLLEEPGEVSVSRDRPSPTVPAATVGWEALSVRLGKVSELPINRERLHQPQKQLALCLEPLPPAPQGGSTLQPTPLDPASPIPWSHVPSSQRVSTPPSLPLLSHWSPMAAQCLSGPGPLSHMGRAEVPDFLGKGLQQVFLAQGTYHHSCNYSTLASG